MLYFYLLSRQRRAKLNQPGSPILALLLDIIFSASVSVIITLKYAEKISWNESVWQWWQTVFTVGYGNHAAETVLGRYIVMFGTSICILCIPIVAGVIFNNWQDAKTRRRLGLMSNKEKCGYVVFNLPICLPTLVREWRSVEPNVPVCVVDNRAEQLPESIDRIPYIHFVRNKLLSQATFQQAGIKDCKKVIVFPSNPGESDCDATTKVLVQEIAEYVGPDIQIIYIQVDEENSWLFNGLPANCSPIYESLEALAVVQESQDPYTGPAIQRLLSNTVGSNPKTVTPDRLHDMIWYDFVKALLEASARLKVDVNPMALIHNGVPHNCPSREDIISPGDQIMLICKEGLDWSTLQEEICRIKDSVK